MPQKLRKTVIQKKANLTEVNLVIKFYEPSILGILGV